MKKLLLLLLSIVAVSCTPEETQEKCFTVNTSGWESRIGYFIKDGQGEIIPTLKIIETGTVYCRE